MDRWTVALRLGQGAKQAFLDLLFPPRCAGCHKLGDWLCEACLASIERVRPPICPRCGRPVPHARLCAVCRRTPSSLDSIRAVAYFEGSLREAIHSFKYENNRNLAGPLGRLLCDYVAEHPLPADAIVPVPLHVNRLRERGYNQSALLGRELSRQTGLPVVEDVLHRIRETVPQVNLDAQSRRQNVRDAFQCANHRLRGLRVVLIDDVCTTGATLNACGVALRQIGVVSVQGLTLARAR